MRSSCVVSRTSAGCANRLVDAAAHERKRKDGRAVSRPGEPIFVARGCVCTSVVGGVAGLQEPLLDSRLQRPRTARAPVRTSAGTLVASEKPAKKKKTAA